MRQTNIELLRITAMIAVIMVHLDGAALGLPSPAGSLTETSAADWWKLSVESLTIIGVNCFTLISGYFGIRARLSGFIRFTLMCMLYSTGIYLIFAATGKIQLTAQELIESLMIYTHTDLWYVPAYMGLYLLSPFINAATDIIDKKQFRYCLAAFVAFNVWAGWLWHGNFNPTGYTTIQLVMMYLIGRYIGRFVTITDSNRHRTRTLSVATYAACSAITTILAIYIEPTMAFAYNSPATIAASVALLLFFASLRIQSSNINEIATTAFAAYLIHKNPYVWVCLIRPLCNNIWHSQPLWAYTIFILAFSVAIYSLSWTIDNIRAQLFRKVETLLDNKVKI